MVCLVKSNITIYPI